MKNFMPVRLTFYASAGEISCLCRFYFLPTRFLPPLFAFISEILLPLQPQTRK